MNADITVESWLNARSSDVPSELRARIDEMLADTTKQRVDFTALVTQLRKQLQTLLDAGTTSREVALDLLAVDAIATYALELQANMRHDLDTSANEMMASISSLLTS